MLLYEAYLLTNATVVDDAIRFVSTRSNGKLEASGKSNQDEKEESNGPDYHDGRGGSVRRRARRGSWRNNKPSFLN
jgi:hypothetical protein